MDYTAIINNLHKHISLSDSDTQAFTSTLVYKKLKRKQLWIREGDICRYSAFVISGVLRGYTVDSNGFEHVLSFAPADWWMADMYSLLTQKQGILNIEAMEETEVLLLPKASQEKLYLQIPQLERFFRILTEKSLVASQQRLIDNLSLTALERYLKFCQRYPTLIYHLPQKQIAAYIGVTPEFFSKMRKEM